MSVGVAAETAPVTRGEAGVYVASATWTWTSSVAAEAASDEEESGAEVVGAEVFAAAKTPPVKRGKAGASSASAAIAAAAAEGASDFKRPAAAVGRRCRLRRARVTTSMRGPTTPGKRGGDVVALRLPFGNPPVTTREYAND